MKTSTDRILTTHTGRLPRPKPLVDLILQREDGHKVDADAFEAQVADAVDEIVAQQVAAGIDIVSDGEMSKPSYTTYIRHRVEGIAPDPRAAEKGRDIMDSDSAARRKRHRSFRWQAAGTEGNAQRPADRSQGARRGARAAR